VAKTMTAGIVKRKKKKEDLKWWNIETLPILPVQEPGTSAGPKVQRNSDFAPGVINPYTLLALIPAEATCFSCLDLKEAFFCIQLANRFLFSNGRIPNQGGTAINLDPSPSGLQNSNYL
jgi:hypothetical protein